MKRSALIAMVLGVSLPFLLAASPGLPVEWGAAAVAAGSAAGQTPCQVGPGADCAGADLTGWDLESVDLSGADLTSAILDHANAAGANLSRADVAQASLVQTTLDTANLASSDFSSAHLTQASARQVRGQGIDASSASLVKADFNGSDFTGGSFRSVMGTQADFTNVKLANADLSGADLFGANLTGADLTGAMLRNASLLKATLDASTILTGADLSGATWVDGRRCLEGSVGACAFASTTGAATELPPSSGAAVAVVKIALAIGKFASDCQKNYSKTQSCWDSGGPDLSAITNGIADLRKQIEANQLVLEKAMNEIFKSQAEEAMLARFNSVKKNLLLSSFALLKYQEFSNCLAQFNDPKYQGAVTRECMLTDINGLNPQPYKMDKVEDLFTGSTGPLTDDMKDGGPAARLYFASLYQFGGKANFQPSNLRDVGLEMQQNIAGDQAHKGKDGLLYATYKSRNADLLSSQNGRIGATPRFLPGTYLAEMNNWAGYYVNGQAAFFGPAVAALTLQVNGEADTPEFRMAATLANQAASGVRGQPQFALDQQLATYTTPFDYYRVSADESADRPDKVGFVTGSDGKVYRIQQMNEATDSPHGFPQFVFPSFNQLALMKSSVEDSGARWSSIQATNPAMLPGGANAAWWATFGSSWKIFLLGNPFFGKTTWRMFASSNLAPAAGRFGDNITWARSDAPCVIPVRLWDSRPSAKDSYVADLRRGARDWDNYNFSAQKMFGRDAKNAKKHYEFTVDGQQAYDTVVRTGATPAYDINDPQQVNPWPGTGLLWRCDGRHSDEASDLKASWMSVQPFEAKGLLAMLSPGQVKFESCTELRRADWRGIGLPNATDQNSDVDADNAPPRNDMHRWDADWYEINKDLDTDNDGIACELTQ